MLLNLTDLVAFFLCITNSDVINEGIDYQFFMCAYRCLVGPNDG